MKFTVQQNLTLTKLLSENSLSQSWLALDPVSGSRRFVKIPAPNSPIGQETARSLLTRSYELQRRLKSHAINRALTKHFCDGQVIIEYPYLSDIEWHDLSPEIFFKFFPDTIIQIAEIIDYLHLFNLVHCDIKFENFRVNVLSQKARIVLCDLDFLSEAHSQPDSRIFGTPGFIPPEQLNDEIILPQSDAYSFGKVLLEAIESFQKTSPSHREDFSSLFEKLGQLAGVLTFDSPSRRPTNLIEALARFEIIKTQELVTALRKLFGMKLVSDFRVIKNKLKRQQIPISHLISENNKVMGVPTELLDAIDSRFEIDHGMAIAESIELLDKATIERHGEYWHLGLDDNIVSKMLGIDSDRFASRTKRRMKSQSDVKGISDTILKSALRHKKNGHHLRAYLILKNFQETVDAEKGTSFNENTANNLVELATLAQDLGRTDEAIAALTKVIVSRKVKKPERLKLLSKIGYLLLLAGDYVKAKGYLGEGIALSEETNDFRSRLGFKRQLASVDLFSANKEKALNTIDSLKSEANALSSQLELGKLHVLSGLLHWRSGDYEMAEQNLLVARKLLRLSADRMELVSPLGNLSMIYFEQADYERSVKYGKLAVSYAEGSTGIASVSAVYTTLVLSYARLGDYNKSHFWLQKYLASSRYAGSSNFYKTYYFLKGNLQIRMGLIDQAQESLNRAFYLYRLGQKDRNLGKVHFNLALASLYRGNRGDFEHYINLANESFSQLSDRASLEESRLLSQLYSVVYDSANTTSLIDLFGQLKSLNCRYYAAVCLFHILILSENDTGKRASLLGENLTTILSNTKVPLFSAISEITKYRQSEKNDAVRLLCLKNAFKILLSSHNKFYALLLCRQIGYLYQNDVKTKLAAAYYEHGIIIADELRNSIMKQDFEHRLRSLPQDTGNSARIIAVLSGISEILKNVADYDLALRKLVEYAVNETGAERGVLLVKHEQKKDYYAKTFVNCDQKDITDIKNISSQITSRVVEDISSLIIENALVDERTRGFKSVVANNILSVICVPIQAEGEIKGVLYLDHHTIPALFKPQDVLFINSIANFISSIYSMIQNFRFQDLSAKQMKQDLTSLGAHQPLITRNTKMRELLSDLTRIAKSNAPVLILGESGTGKEMLAQLVHDLSFRTKKPLVKLNCAAIAPTLMESELFGIAKNVATGVDEREGKLSSADGSALFLDEIADLPLEAQSKILRAIENQEFERVGSNRTITTDIRFIAATNKDLRELVRIGKFREDLFYRINTITLQIPALRERVDDIPLLLDHFLKLASVDEKRRPVFSEWAIICMQAYNWPGNVRELKNLVERISILYPATRIDRDKLPAEMVNYRPVAVTRRLPHGFSRDNLKSLLVATDWNKSEVSRQIHIPLSTLCRILKKYGLSRPL